MLRFFADRRGSISTISALTVGVMIALAGLVVHGSQLYVLKVREQRTADLAVLAAGGVSGAISGGAPSAAAVAAARNIAEVNGFSAAGTVLSATNDTDLNVSVAAAYSRIFQAPNTTRRTIQVNSSASAKLSRAAPPCVIAIGTDVQIKNGAVLEGASCSVIGASGITVYDASLNAAAAAVGVSREVEAGLVKSAQRLSPALGDFIFNAANPDPMAGDARVRALDAKLASMASGWPYGTQLPRSLEWPTVPSGPDVRIDAVGNGWIGQSARVGNLFIGGSTATFQGSGGPDPNCTRPTTIAGDTLITRGSTIFLNSGCYIFRGNITHDEGAAGTSSGVHIVDGAEVKLVVTGQLINSTWGRIRYPRGTYSIAGGLRNVNGGTLDFGAGPKVIGGTIDNGFGYMFLGDGPFYIQSATVQQKTGTITFGTGPTYIYSSVLTNGEAGTMKFGPGGLFVFASHLGNGDRAAVRPLMMFDGGPYNFVASRFNTSGPATTYFAAGDMELYQSSFVINGGLFAHGDADATSSGSVSMVGSSYAQTGGTFSVRGVTFAANSSVLSFAGGTLDASAPSGSAPAYGTRNLLMYSQNGSVYFNLGGSQKVSGVIYAPQGSVDYGNGSYSGNCHATVAAAVKVWDGATVAGVPCGDFIWPAPLGATPKLIN